MADFFIKQADIISGWLVVIIASMFPIVELRGAIPIGIALKLDPIYSTILAIIGSTIPVPFIFFMIRPILNYLRKTRIFKNSVERLINKAMSKSDQIVKYEFWGLLIFVGIPLPGTGAWTGTLIAALLDLRFKKTILAIFLGNVMAGTIVFMLSHLALFSIKLF